MTSPDPTPLTLPAERIDLGPEPENHTPNAARIYDAILGGTANFAADRQAAAHIMSMIPSAVDDAYANRAFLARAVRYLLAHDVDQFIDLGAGLPTAGNVHDIAQGLNPAARVVYIDQDPVVTTYSRRLLGDTPGVTVLEADLRDPTHVLDSTEVLDLLDLTKPVGLLAVAVLHFVSDEHHPQTILAAYRNKLAAGSHLVLSHATAEHLRLLQWSTTAAVYENTPTPLTLRSREEIRDLTDGWTLIPHTDDEPSDVVPVNQWRWPDDLAEPDPAARNILGAVGYLPGRHT